MASRPWSDAEIAVLEQCADNCDVATACRHISGRTIGAIKTRMAKIRTELGLGDGRHARSGGDGREDQWMGDAVIASQTLLAATLRVGVWS